jgi:RNA polymerase sigma factor (sigma-70 family)
MERNAYSTTLTNDKDAIIDAIYNGGMERESALKALYEDRRIYRSIAKTVREYGGHTPDIKEIFQETIILFDRMVRNEKFKGESSVETYIIGIGRNLCRNWNRLKQGPERIYSGDIWSRIKNTQVEEEESIYEREMQEVLGSLFDRLKPVCKSVLRLWQLNYSMEQISEQLELGSVVNARKRKYRCMKELMALIEKHPNTQNYLHEVWKTKI